MKAFCPRASKQPLAVTLIAVIFFCTLSLVQRSSAQNLSAEDPSAQELATQQAALTTPSPLIVQPIDESQLTVLHGNTHPLARPQFDLGTAPATLPMQRMLLVLKRSAQQEAALRKLLDDQQDKASPSYHKWLTPADYGKQFGPTDTDIQTITAWLQSHGFEVGTTKGRTVLEFSGSASQVQEAFHTTMHKYIVNGEQHWANANDPQIPTALTPAVVGVITLHNFLKKPQLHLAKEPAPARMVPGKKPQVTFPAQNGQSAINALGPQDYAVIYDINPTYNNNITGSGVTIGVVGRSDPYNGGEDISDFRNYAFALCCGNFNIVVNGPDPGDLGGGEEGEATLDSTWSGAIAYNASVDLVVSATTNTTDGIDLSELYIVENNLADIMTESFSSCELYATDAQLAFSYDLAEQAAAQGISYFVSTGDNGAEGCDDPSSPPATQPISISLLASTPFNVAVGGTMLNENGQPSVYWGSEPPVEESAVSYIPEDVWNESGPTLGLWSSSGGASAGNIGNGLGGTTPGILKPSWQSTLITGVPNDGVRDVPDVSLTAASHDPYLICLEGSCLPNGQGEFFIYFVGGTSASAPSFAGIMALVDQQMAILNPTLGPRQGQANYVLYPLAASQGATLSSCNASNTITPPAASCIFNDVTVGNNVVPGEVGSQYQATPGYDQTTGLGSVNVANLVSAWAAAVFRPTATKLELNSVTTSITVNHGASVPVSVSVAPSSGTGTPTGVVSLIAAVGGSAGGPNGVNGFTLTNGSTLPTATTAQLPGGNSYLVHAHYAGDGTFAPSDSNSVTVTVNAENSATTVSAFNASLNGIPQIAAGSTLPFGTYVFVRADVVGVSHQGVPTGMVTFTDTFGSLPGSIFNPVSNPVALNSQGNTSIGAGVINFDAGAHGISATYPGDPSFNPSQTVQPVTFTIQPGFAGVSGPTNVTITSPGLSGTTTVGIITSSNFSTAVSFACTGLPAEATCTSSPVTGTGPNTPVSGTITITTTAPHVTMLQPGQRPHYFAAILGAGLPLFGIILLAAPKQRRSSVLLGLAALALVVALPACGGGGGGGGGHQQDPGSPAGSYTVTVTATAGSLSQQASFTLTVQ
jgi:subtilase family serine protease